MGSWVAGVYTEREEESKTSLIQNRNKNGRQKMRRQSKSAVIRRNTDEGKTKKRYGVACVHENVPSVPGFHRVPPKREPYFSGRKPVQAERIRSMLPLQKGKGG